MRAGDALERAPGRLVQLGAAREQEVLVDDLVHERVGEAIARALAAGPGRLDQIGLDEALERRRGPSPRRSPRRAGATRRTPRPARRPPAAGGARRPEAGRPARAASPAGSAGRRPPRRPPCSSSARPCGRARPCPPGSARSPRRTADCRWRASRRSPGAGPSWSPPAAPKRPTTSARVSSRESGWTRMTDCAARVTCGGRASGRCESSTISGLSARWSTTFRSRSIEALSAQWRSSTTISSGSCWTRRSSSARAARTIWRCSCSGSTSSRLRVLHAEHVAQHRRDGLGLFRAGAERPEAVDQLLPGDVERVGLVDLVGVAEERPEDAVGRLARATSTPRV